MCDLPLEERHIFSELLLQVDKILKESILQLSNKLSESISLFLFISHRLSYAFSAACKVWQVMVVS